MTQAHVAVFDKTLQMTHEWLDALQHELGLHDHQQAYSTLRAVLHVLRDRLTLDEAAHLGAQLPMLVRGIYYEQWSPSKAPRKQRNKAEFLESIQEELNPGLEVDPSACAKAVFTLLDRRISEGEVEEVRHMLPAEIRVLWPSEH